MAMDPAGAALALSELGENSYLLSLGTDIMGAGEMSTWNMQIEGAYALLWPKIHWDYSTTVELEAYMYEEIEKLRAQTSESFLKLREEISTAWLEHNTIPQHAAIGGSNTAIVPGEPIIFDISPEMTPEGPTTVLYVPNETGIIKMSRPVQEPSSISDTIAPIDLELGIMQSELIIVKADSPSIIGLSSV